MNMYRFALVLLLSALLLSFCVGCSDRKSDGKFKVGVVAVTSGELFRKGNYIITAARYGADKINKDGGLELGGQSYKVKLFPADSNGEPEIAAKVTRRLIEKEKVSAIVGAASSKVALAVAEVCEEHKVPFITPVAGTNKLTSFKYSFRVSYTNTVQGEALALFAKKDLGQKDVGVLFDSGSPYSSELGRFFKEDYIKGGGRVVSFQSYAAGERKFSAQLKKIVESGAQILFLPNNTKKVQLQVAQARKMGFEGILMGSDSWDPIELQRNELFKNSYYTDHWIPGLPIKGAAEFEKDYKKKNGVDPSELEALTYDAVMSLFAGAKIAGTDNPVSIHDALVDMPPFHGVTGTFAYNNNGDPDKDVIISTFRDGHIAVQDIIDLK
ncbi:ABC transporter substrate-binding protein [Desulfovibrio sp. JC010]|uniref:ABC transporter substrate-binding protein n=1 Tax=Desulfovibrio sp. JC010 TaxID=2593641 RepID=UPI0013D7F9C2|nr:ABC transporter substrate-binding protein [Desulfovibrio sp. JC010]NDV26636.1 ABC transporter substrate-binding protein [Desulfovibrio sp. JC010]